MFKDFFEAISNFFKSIFGKKESPKPKPIPKPPVDLDDENIETTLQDAIEVPTDTIQVVNEAKVLDEIVATTTDAPDPGSASQPDPNTDASTPEDKQEDEETNQDKKHKPRFLWCLDNGHGKLQAGKRSPKFYQDGAEVQLLEYKFNRDIVNRITKALDEKGVSYFDVVPDFNDVGSFLKGRVERANKKTSSLPKLYISVHANAGPTSDGDWTSASGIETWYHQNSSKGKKIAAIFQNHLIGQLPNWRNRHLKSTAIKGLYVLKNTHMPAILTENGFYNNRKEVEELLKDDVRQKIADAHVNAIMEIEQNGL